MKNNNEFVTTDPGSSQHSVSKGPSRRKFLSQVSAALAGGAVFGKAALASGQSSPNASGMASPRRAGVDPRVQQSYLIRKAAATAEGNIPVPPHTTNGDEQRYPDKSGTYTQVHPARRNRAGQFGSFPRLSGRQSTPANSQISRM